MKKLVLSIAFIGIALAGNAQIIKSNLFSNYKEGDSLEKAAYAAPSDPIQQDTWCTAFMKRPVPGSESPKLGAGLTYPGYPEGGLSAILGFPKGLKGSHNSTYSMTTGKQHKKGVFYLACLVNMKKAGTTKPLELIAMNATYAGGSARSQVLINKTEDGKIRFTVACGKLRTENNQTYDFGKTYLIVLKQDYTNKKVSMFINPDLNGTEPKADAEVDGTTAANAAIKAFSFKNAHSYQGNIGNFRLVKSWADLTTQPVQ